MWKNTYIHTYIRMYCIVQNSGGVKLWLIDHFRFWARKMLANLQMLTLATLVILEFGWVKYWQMIFVSPNSPKFSPARILYYMVYNSQLIKTVSYVIKFPAFGFILTAY